MGLSLLERHRNIVWLSCRVQWLGFKLDATLTRGVAEMTNQSYGPKDRFSKARLQAISVPPLQQARSNKCGGLTGGANQEKGKKAQRPPITTRTFHSSCPTSGRVFRRLDNRFRARVPRRRRVGQGLQANRCCGGSGHVEGHGQASWLRALTQGGAIAGRLPNTGLRLSRKTCRLPNSPSSAQLSRFPAR